MSGAQVAVVSPALEKYAKTALAEVWKRPGLSRRDRSLGTVAALVAGNRAVELPHQIDFALNHGVTPAELSELITHLAFYSGWASAMTADRSLVTVSALVASGQVAQIPYHLNRAMDNGLTAAEAGELLTQLAFYAGWPNVFSALPVFKDVFEKRAK